MKITVTKEDGIAIVRYDFEDEFGSADIYYMSKKENGLVFIDKHNTHYGSIPISNVMEPEFIEALEYVRTYVAPQCMSMCGWNLENFPYVYKTDNFEVSKDVHIPGDLVVEGTIRAGGCEIPYERDD